MGEMTQLLCIDTAFILLPNLLKNIMLGQRLTYC